MNKLRVVHISRGFEDYVISLVNSLSKHVELHVVVATADEWMTDELDNEVKVFKSAAPRVSSAGNALSLYRLVKFIKAIRPDVIHLQNGVLWESFIPIIFPNIPIVVTIHDVTQHPTRNKIGFTPQRMLDFLVSKSDSVIVHSNSIREKARRHFAGKINNDQINVVPHGVIERYGSGKAKTEATGRVLFFGTIDQWKGLEYLVKAEPLVREAIADLQIKIAGRARDIEYYAGLVQPGQCIDMRLERQSKEQIKDLFSWADVLVLPYIEASQSGVLNLGISFSLPAIVTNVGGLPDIIKDEQNGLIVEAKDIEGLSKAIIRMLSDRTLRGRVIANLEIEKNSVHSRCSIAKKTAAIYQNLVYL